MAGKEKTGKDSGRGSGAPALPLAVCFLAAVFLVAYTFGVSVQEPAPGFSIPASSVPSSPAARSGDGPVRLGLVRFSYAERNAREIDHTVELLRKAFAPRELLVKELSAEDLDRAVRSGKVDFFVASSGFYWRMIPYGARNLATLVSARRPDPNRSDAAAFVVRSESPAKDLADLKGKVLSASYPTAFIGYRIAMAEVARRGFDPERFFSRVNFAGAPYVEPIMEKLANGNADAAIIPACAWESWPEDERKKYRLLDAEKKPGIGCLATTDAYPGHTLAVMNGVSPRLARDAVQTLLEMKGGEDYWSIATDFTPVDRAYRLLKLGPYAHLREATFRSWVTEHRTALLFILLLIAGLALHAIRSDTLVRRRTEELRAEEAGREAAARELSSLNERMERMHKLNVVAQLSSMISHELAQPLAAVRYYGEGAAELLKSDEPDRAMLQECCRKSIAQTDRAIAIVEKVRSYAKHGGTRSDRVDLASTLRQVLSELRAKGIERAKVESDVAGPLVVRGDALELELLLWNILKNALEAALETPDPRIRIEGGSHGGTALLSIRNSGKPLTEEDVSRIVSPLESTKGTGLGLGVGIASSIAESTGGGIEFLPNPGGGLEARIRLPLDRDGEKA
ncbi:MAG: PhnD/SsuA/transferrin family substrate-binding protein [Sutterellaceae bacterium]|nr:PhnD/SsuA/transferrin family substrate-binding protein [Sutterellaceae bacterium]MDY2868835.1 PhnD/SsuA/transferrin family substrate-binding protein [Mesosutterella sp.]